MEYILVGLGGTLGGITRYALGKAISKRSKSGFPLGTFIINISGAFLLGLLNGTQTGVTVSLLLGDGFIGAYTTFSTFMYEGVNLFQDREKLNACIYIIGSLFLGISGFVFGFWLGHLLSNI